MEDAVNVGDTFTFKIGLQDDAIALPVEDEVTIRVVDEEAQSAPKAKEEGSRTQEAGEGGTGKSEGTGEAAATRELPPYCLLTEDGRLVAGKPTERWPEGFSDQDGGIAVDLGNQTMFKINYDNVYHQAYRRAARGDVSKEVVTQKYTLGMLILMLGCDHAIRQMPPESEAAEYADEFRQTAGRGAASTVLALAENLPKIIDAGSVIANADVE